MKVSKLDFNYRDMHIQYCKSTYDKRVASCQSINHQIHPLSAISTTGKKGRKRAKIQGLPKCTSIVGKIDLKR